MGAAAEAVNLQLSKETAMKRVFLSILMAGALAACQSTPVPEQKEAPVTDAKPDTGPRVDVDRPPVKPVDPSATPFKPDAVGASALTDPKSILSKRSIYFDYDSNMVKDEYRPMVQAHAQYLQRNGATRMRIEGNADDRGSREYNLALGQRRADAVKQMMQVMGARADQIETVSFGEEKPKCSEAAESCYAQNRRGDIFYPGVDR
jgi:peptidoglycan-associated lipoprotein